MAGFDGAPADCWALGILIWILFDGTHPFRGLVTYTHTPPEVDQMTEQASKMWREATAYDKEVLVHVVRGGFRLRTSRKFGENLTEGQYRVKTAHLID